MLRDGIAKEKIRGVGVVVGVVHGVGVARECTAAVHVGGHEAVDDGQVSGRLLGQFFQTLESENKNDSGLISRQSIPPRQDAINTPSCVIGLNKHYR